MAVHWYADSELPVIVWKKFSATGAYRKAFEKLLSLIREKSVTVGLSDFQDLSVLDSEDQTWVRTVWLPSAAEAGLRHFAVVMPQSTIGKSSLLKGIRFDDGARLEIAYFPQRDQSHDWIRRVRAVSTSVD